ncbi:MAG TPA: MgtC/SapB family protein [Saprospiraceae bacterium]|nr:MgtC/SapB family protein [Saprospiraceae bacterium]
MIEYKLFKILGIALGLGLLVGMQREYKQHRVAGIRTFALATLLGSITGLIAEHFDAGIIVAIGGLCLALLLVTVNFIKQKDKEIQDLGQTTEVAFLLMYALGVYLSFGNLNLGVALGGMIALLLHYKSRMGQFVDNLDPKDIRAIMQFVAITLVILPILPNQTYGPYDVLNPREVWLMVVLIVSLSMIGYIIYKVLDKDSGTIANGLLGGLISSTATTVTFSRRTNEMPKAARLAAFIIMTASAVSIVRVLVEVSVVSPQSIKTIAPPLIAEFVFMVLVCTGLYFYNRNKETQELPEPNNPAQLKSALVFGFLYAFILLAVAAAKDYFGESGLYIVSFISGLTDVDAITLSLSQSLNQGNLDSQLAWKLMLVAALSNLIFKGGMASVLGTKSLSKYVWIVFALSIVFGVFLIFLWPETWVF